MAKTFRVALALTVVCGVAALALSVVYVVTKERIAEEAKIELNEALVAVFPGGGSFIPIDLSTLAPLPESKELQFLEAYEVTRDGKRQGFVIKASSAGYGGPIILLIGVDTEKGVLTGIRVLEHQETPGLGSNVAEEAFLSQFRGKSLTDPFTIGEDVQTISGATISSRAVIRACVKVAELLRGEGQ
ncbi:MAG: RnfABCDGE type electron transport complex subunit G [Candidatus Caldatribacterium sp.]|uniref:RnfABCDGE type electron transport complex subunit G n=1 Tax=Candidatus Caldatribacterium sp. TaxID=2282143 RepID=UPI0029914E33|nr:RnfABCDGE type electron transport complex subunit G [Candidatus Caldatribacterium sp.]MCX7730211.1 RnfABCDGE type electron transport complex subunit G [Candidatus Caldatribacterium sp.]MDW8081618.1 RnfABCDGE type electron transport complex subunit G [Candidatus Calescibacterium sp.]